MPPSLRAEAATLVAHGLHVDRAPRVARLEVDVADLHADPNGPQVEARAAQATITLREDDLAAFVQGQMPDRVELNSLQITVEGILLRLGLRVIVSIPARARLGLAICDARALHLILHDVEVLGTGPKQLVEGMLAKVNPVFDAGELPIPLRLTEVEYGAGELKIFAEADLRWPSVS